MNYKLLYGKGALTVSLPDNLTIDVIEPRFQSGFDDPLAEISKALESPIGSGPLRTLFPTEGKVGIVFSDISRATPYQVILPPLLSVLGKKGAEIIFFNATGTHRANTKEELTAILGSDIVSTYPIVQNNCAATDKHSVVGVTSYGNQVSLLNELLACDIKILTGFIEPHFFAGFSGGGKALMPGLAKLSTIQHNHGARNIDNNQARWGVTEGNPIWEDVMEAAEMVENTFLLNVAMNRDKDITGVYAGRLREAHAEGVNFVKEQSMVRVPHLYDLVITSNSGYPLDLNLYQAVKGMSAANEIVGDGGNIIIAAYCWDGIPAHGLYGKLIQSATSPKELLQTIRDAEKPVQDMWQAQIHAKICMRATVHLYTENLSEEEIRMAFLQPVRSIEQTVSEIIKKHGEKESLKVCVLPEGPLTIPYYP